MATIEERVEDLERRVTILEKGPVDCVLGERYLVKTEESDCQNGTKIVTRYYQRDVVQEPLNGGMACPPSESVETEVVTCTGNVVFPPVEPVMPLLSFPEPRSYKSSQWHIDLGKDRDPNAMQHIHLEYWHPRVVKSGVFQVDIFARHYHLQGCTYLGIRKSVVRVEGVQKWLKLYPGQKEVGRRSEIIPSGDAGHDITYVDSIVYDVRQVPFGNYRFEVDLSLRRTDGRLSHTRTHFNVVIDNDDSQEAIEPVSRMSHTEGWESPETNDEDRTGYTIIHAAGLREYTTDPEVPISLKIDAPAGELTELLICKNPNLHSHPPDYGEIIRQDNFIAFGVVRTTNPDGTVTQKEIGDKRYWKMSIPAITGLKEGDRLMIRILNNAKPTIGAFASLIVNKIQKR